MTDADMIKHLWTHKTQDHPSLSDEDLMIERGKGVHVWNTRGQKPIDAYRRACGGARRSRPRGNRGRDPRAGGEARVLSHHAPVFESARRRARREARDLTPGDLDYALYAVSGAEANERSIQIARHYWLQAGRPRKYKIISLNAAITAAHRDVRFRRHRRADEGLRTLSLEGFTKVPMPYPIRNRGGGTDEELVRRCADALADAIREAEPETVAAVILEPVQAPAAASSRRSAGSRACATSATTSTC